MEKLLRKLPKQPKTMENSFIDLIIRIKNGYLARREEITSPYSKFREEILKLLKKLAYIKDFRVEEETIKKITVELLYQKGRPALTDVKLISKPGQRTYVSYRILKSVLGGMGHSILSTSKGVMTNSQAKKEKVGGELLFNIW